MDAKAAAARDSDGDVQQILDKARTAAAEGKIGGVKPLEMSLKGDDNTEEKGVAGRKKMKVQKEKEGKGEDEEEESQEDQEVKSTLNGILKRSPSTSALFPYWPLGLIFECCSERSLSEHLY